MSTAIRHEAESKNGDEGMECAAKGRSSPCLPGRPPRRCGICGAVSYCSPEHQKLHWNDHKEECARFEQQMQLADSLNDFVFSFPGNSGSSGCEEQLTRCSFFTSSGLHLKPMWKLECSCWSMEDSLDRNSSPNEGWSLPTSLCPCSEPRSPISTCLGSWEDYYRWRGLPFNSPAALLLHWPLTIYHCFQLYASQSLSSSAVEKFFIHYLGPEKELSQLVVFAELLALLPSVQMHIEFVGPSVPQFRDGETIKLSRYAQCSDGSCSCKSSSPNLNRSSSHTNSTLTLKLHKGFYHEKYGYMELISKIGVPAIFSDFCEEAAFLAARCVSTVTGRPLPLPLQVNPFRQPMLMEDQALYLPCYSNCFLFGM